MTIKSNLLDQCKGLINDRLLRVKKSIATIEAGLNAETKSTAGDKHETGRAMLQLEREKAGAQLLEVEKQQSILNKIQAQIKTERVALGSVVFTSGATYFLSVSAGELFYNENSVYAVSLESPIGQILKGKTENEVVSFRGSEFQIIKIL